MSNVGEASITLDLDGTAFGRKLKDAVTKAVNDAAASSKQAFSRIEAGASEASGQMALDFEGAAEAAGKALGDIDTSGVKHVATVAQEASGQLAFVFEAGAAAAGAALAEIGAEASPAAARVAGSLEAAGSAARGALSRIGLGLVGIGAEAAGAAGKVSAAFETAATKSQAALSKIGSASLSVVKPVGLIAGVTSIAGLALAGFGLKTAASLEQTQVAFTGLLGSSKAANAEIARLQTQAAATPFEFSQLVPAAQRLIAMGDSADVASKKINIIGDALASAGAGGDAIEQIVTPLSQIQSLGKVTADNLNQISNILPTFSRGAFTANLAKDLGKTTEATAKLLNNGAIPATVGLKALYETFQQLPGAMGAMGRQSVTLDGLLSTFSDTVKNKLTNAFLPLVPTIKGALTQITPIIDSALTTLAPAIAGFTTQLLDIGLKLAPKLGPLLTNLFLGLRGALAEIQPRLPQISAAFDSLTTAIIPLSRLFANLAGAGIGTLATNFVLLAPTITAVATALNQFASSDAGKTLLPLIVDSLLLQKALGPAASAFGALATGLKGASAAASAFKTVKLGEDLAKNAGGAAKFGAALAGAGPRIATFGATLLGLASFETIAAVATTALDVALAILTSPITLVVAAVALLVGGIILAYNHFKPFHDAVDATGRAIRDAAVAVADFVSHLDFGAIGSSILGFFTSLPGTIGSFLSSLPGLAGAALSSLGNSILSGLQATGSAILGFFTSLPGLIGGALAALPGILGQAALAFITFAFEALAQLLLLPVRIGLILLAVGPAIFNALSTAFTFAAGAVEAGLITIAGFLLSLPGRALAALASLGSALQSAFNTAFAFAQAAVLAGLIAVTGFLLTLPARAGSALAALPGVLAGAARSAFNGMVSAVSAGASFVVSAVQAIPGKLAALAGAFLSAGSALIRGFLSGLSRAGGAIGNLAGSIGSAVLSAVRASANAAITGIERAVNSLPGISVHLPRFARGAVVDEPTLGIFGEAGKEVILPLSDPAAAAKLLLGDADGRRLVSVLVARAGKGSLPATRGTGRAAAGVSSGDLAKVLPGAFPLSPGGRADFTEAGDIRASARLATGAAAAGVSAAVLASALKAAFAATVARAKTAARGAVAATGTAAASAGGRIALPDRTTSSTTVTRATGSRKVQAGTVTTVKRAQNADGSTTTTTTKRVTASSGTVTTTVTQRTTGRTGKAPKAATAVSKVTPLRTASTAATTTGAAAVQAGGATADVATAVAGHSLAALASAADLASRALNQLAAVANATAVRSAGGQGNVAAFARGTIASSPVLGVFGEAGKEALLPLKDRRRSAQLLLSDPDGRALVTDLISAAIVASGQGPAGSATSNVFNITPATSSVEELAHKISDRLGSVVA